MQNVGMFTVNLSMLSLALVETSGAESEMSFKGHCKEDKPFDLRNTMTFPPELKS